MDPSLSKAISPPSRQTFFQSLVSRIGRQSAPELPTHSGHISQATGKDSDILPRGMGAAISDEDASEGHPQIRGKPALEQPPDALEGSQVVFKSGPQPIQKINNIPDEWVEDIHPDGQLLYSTVVSSRDLMIRVHTDVALRDTENHRNILAAFGQLSQLLDSSEELHNAELEDSEVEACILVSDDFPDEFGYYLVNHRDQTTFWLEEIKASDLNMEAYDEDIYRHKLAEQYWRHVTDFPHYCCLSPKAGTSWVR
ncbi:hypothetical protein FRC05_003542 [Tulasnella sp. 425]|nr:hypothetical protein FRC05_003542 [Tulasnella sp. 425]